MGSLVKLTVYRTDIGVTDDLSPATHRPPARGAGTAARRLGVTCEAGACYDREAR